MRPTAFLASCAALLAAVVASACAGTPRAAAPAAPAAPPAATVTAAEEHVHDEPASAHGPAHDGGHAAGGASTGAASPAAIAQARADSAIRPYTEADVRFMTGMIGHHAQAIVMSRLAASHGAGASVRTLADRIINAQQDEIGLMQQWLRERGRPVPQPLAAGAAHGAHDAHGDAHGDAMPGMLSPEQLRQLDAARGEEFDRLFLTFMIQHHRGATAMVRDLFGSYGAGQDHTIFKFASDVNVDQTTEIARMQRMLAALLFEDGSK